MLNDIQFHILPLKRINSILLVRVKYFERICLGKKEKKKCYDCIPFATRQCEKFYHFLLISSVIFLHIFTYF